MIPDQSELDAELDAYNKGREKKAKLENAAETADPLNDSKDDDILKDSKRMLIFYKKDFLSNFQLAVETNETEKTAV